MNELKIKAKRIDESHGHDGSLVTLSMDVSSTESMQAAGKLVSEHVKSDGIY